MRLPFPPTMLPLADLAEGPEGLAGILCVGCGNLSPSALPAAAPGVHAGGGAHCRVAACRTLIPALLSTSAMAMRRSRRSRREQQQRRQAAKMIAAGQPHPSSAPCHSPALRRQAASQVRQRRGRHHLQLPGAPGVACIARCLVLELALSCGVLLLCRHEWQRPAQPRCRPAQVTVAAEAEAGSG